MKMLVLLAVVLLLIGSAIAADYKLPMANYEISFSLNTTGGEYTEIGIGDVISLEDFSAQSMHIKKPYSGSIDIDYYHFTEPQNTTLENVSQEVSGYPAIINSRERDDGRLTTFIVFWIDDLTRFEVLSAFGKQITADFMDSLRIKQVAR